MALLLNFAAVVALHVAAAVHDQTSLLQVMQRSAPIANPITTNAYGPVPIQAATNLRDILVGGPDEAGVQVMVSSDNDALQLKKELLEKVEVFLSWIRNEGATDPAESIDALAFYEFAGAVDHLKLQPQKFTGTFIALVDKAKNEYRGWNDERKAVKETKKRLRLIQEEKERKKAAAALPTEVVHPPAAPPPALLPEPAREAASSMAGVDSPAAFGAAVASAAAAADASKPFSCLMDKCAPNNDGKSYHCELCTLT